jgi:hypothetical protein
MNEHRGLCISCRNALTCTFLKNPNEAVLQCDEFDGFESFLRRPKIFSHKSMMDPKSNPGKKDLGGYKGLCSICEDRKACTYPKPEGGVWHCEEYR